MQYHAAFSKIKEPQLRRMLLGDDSRDVEPLTGVAFVSPWAWDAVRKIAKRDRTTIGKVLARAVRHYVNAEGFNKPGREAHDEMPQRRVGLFDRLRGLAIGRNEA